jgi:hypothetical protein
MLPLLLLPLLLLLLQDVLGHPATNVFVSHCGMHSVNEAAYHGVPLLAIPFQMEQVGVATQLGNQMYSETPDLPGSSIRTPITGAATRAHSAPAQQHLNTNGPVALCFVRAICYPVTHFPLVPMFFVALRLQAEHAMKLEAQGAAVICKQSLAYRRGSAAATAMTFTADHIADLIREVRMTWLPKWAGGWETGESGKADGTKGSDNKPPN